MMQFSTLALLLASILAAGPSGAAVISYDIDVSSPSSGSGWYGGTLGLPGLPVTGRLTLDNQDGSVGSFSLTAGPTTWSQADFTTTPALSFDSLGNLIAFNLYQSLLVPADNYTMTLSSNNHFEISDPAQNYAGCYGCVSFFQAPAATPLPSALWLMLGGLMGLGPFLFRNRSPAVAGHIPDYACT